MTEQPGSGYYSRKVKKQKNPTQCVRVFLSSTLSVVALRDSGSLWLHLCRGVKIWPGGADPSR
ncbi:MAG: hypothetical protein P4L74_02825 [Candidatus Doudnabacteria bacterium]|nr:hypothetical protein [Candidatus Doudnabacteria bacterium]